VHSKKSAISLIVNNPTLLFELLIDGFEILPDVGPKNVGHARFHINVNDAPNGTVVVIGILRNERWTQGEQRQRQM
jgi:hypothetical protein